LIKQAKLLADAVSKNYQIDFQTPDLEMLAALQKHVWHFTAAKNYQELTSLSLALVDKNGNLRSFAEFVEPAKK